MSRATSNLKEAGCEEHTNSRANLRSDGQKSHKRLCILYGNLHGNEQLFASKYKLYDIIQIIQKISRPEYRELAKKQIELIANIGNN